MARAAGLDITVVATEVVGSTGPKPRARPAGSSTSTEPEVDVEVLVDDAWLPGHLYIRDWHKTSQGRWVCFVRYTTRSPDGWMEHRARHFVEDNIRPAADPSPAGEADR